MGGFIRDLRFGVRMLARVPGFAAIAILTIAIGIGANTAMFSILHAVLLKPLPYQEPDRLVFVRDIQPQLPDLPGSYHEYLDWKSNDQLFEKTGAYWGSNVTLVGDGDPERLRGVRTSAEIFELLGMVPAQGRLLLTSDDPLTAEPVAVLSHGLWQRRFGADPSIVGKSIRIDDVTTTVVGVLQQGQSDLLPTDLRRGGEQDIWMPLRLSRETSSRGSHFLTIVARLQDGVGFPQAEAQIEQVAQNYKDDERTKHGIMLVSLNERIVGGSRTQVLVLMGAVVFVLLIACVNVANLLLARAVARHKEVAIRASLGAGRMRVIRQFLTETMILSGVGGGIGLLLAWAGVKAFSLSPAANLLRTGTVDLSPSVLLFCFGVTLITGIVAGLVPALQAGATDLNETLKADGRRASAGAGKRAFRNTLVIVEVALSLILLVGAGLLLRSFQNLNNVDLGFDPSQLLTFRIALPDAKYDEAEKITAFWDQAIEQVAAAPGVEGVAVVTTLPIEGGWNADFDVEGLTWPEGHSPLAETRRVNQEYFQVMGVPLKQGRGFEPSDHPDATPVVVVNEEFQTLVFNGDAAIGRKIYFGDEESTRYEIVGVVGNVQQWSVGREKRPAVYFSYRQSPQSGLMVAVRTAGDPLAAVGAVRRQVRAVDPDQPISQIRSMDQVLAQDLARRKVSMQLLLGFAILALFLASIGLYGVMNYMVTQRTYEMGVRLALGARGSGILTLVLRQGLAMTSIGLVLGLIGAFALTRYLSSLVYEVSTTDLVTFVAVPLILQLVALLACFLPARRASRVNPVVALR